jgi:hypothetical protein
MQQKNHHSFLFVILFVLMIMLCPQSNYAQPKSKYDISGAWTGYVKTTDKKITYEVVISDSSGTYIGYSEIIFSNKGKEFFAIKSLSIRKEEEKYVLEEVVLMSDNFLDDAPRKIKQVNTLDLVIGTKKMTLSGMFKTKATMGLKSAIGEVFLQKAVVPDSSALFSELGNMGLTENMSFVKEAKEKAAIEIAKEKNKDTVAVVVSVPVPPPPVIKPIPAPAPKPVPAKPSQPIVKNTPAPKPAPVIQKPAPTPSKPATTAAVTPSTSLVARAPKPIPVIAEGSASELSKRSIETIQTVYFKTDSLTLTLYDNGEVDGDTVSVVVNGKVIMGKKGLSTKAITETIYLTSEMGDSLQMIMYAENLGAIAPNTGLLIIQDGKDRYEIRFSGDLSKNAAIIFKRRK